MVRERVRNHLVKVLQLALLEIQGTNASLWWETEGRQDRYSRGRQNYRVTYAHLDVGVK